MLGPKEGTLLGTKQKGKTKGSTPGDLIGSKLGSNAGPSVSSTNKIKDGAGKQSLAHKKQL